MTASARAIDMLGTLRATERLRGEQAQRALAEADARHGEGSALSTAVKAYVRERTSALGANPETVKAALDHANALARDPKTHAGMRANRAAFDRLTPDQKAAAKATRFEIERERRALMDEARVAQAAFLQTSRGEHRRGYSSSVPSPTRQAAYTAKMTELETRYEALLTDEAALPSLPYPKVDPGFAHELGHDAADLLEMQAGAGDALITAGLAITPWSASQATVRMLGKAGAKAFGQATSLGVAGVEARRAASNAIRLATHAEFEERGFDTRNPASLTQLPPEARRRIAIKGAVAALANGASAAVAKQIVNRLTKPTMAELEHLIMEEGVAHAFEDSVSGVIDKR
ncbi:hypothetical protein KAJ83_02430 [Marivibrio halodurans]|uniref:Uncharacterized protein n=1 Tax=Marivibrio halodurans TaxID=2039722 RepID=A0A8J7SGN5_9PROT|nr:hypothetical protein [Marivibrio halodurans]MBP5855848.1 hypothetical protein [Marivibrio halodurans]